MNFKSYKFKDALIILYIPLTIKLNSPPFNYKIILFKINIKAIKLTAFICLYYFLMSVKHINYVALFET